MWKQVQLPTCKMLCDARSHPPRVAVVAIIDRHFFWSDWQPTERIMNSFKSRRDGQIMALELLSIAFGASLRLLPWCSSAGIHSRLQGLSVFREKLTGRNVHIYSDNVGAEWAVRKMRLELGTTHASCMESGVLLPLRRQKFT